MQAKSTERTVIVGAYLCDYFLTIWQSNNPALPLMHMFNFTILTVAKMSGKNSERFKHESSFGLIWDYLHISICIWKIRAHVCKGRTPGSGWHTSAIRWISSSALECFRDKRKLHASGRWSNLFLLADQILFLSLKTR